MFFPDDPTNIVSVLRKIRPKFCVYLTPPGKPALCDCKYGRTPDNVGQMTESGPGCSEIAAAATLIAMLTSFEYQRLIKRTRRKKR